MRRGCIALLVTALITATACQPATTNTSLRLMGQTMGTRFSIEIAETVSAPAQAEIEQAVLDTLTSVDTLASTYRADSELAQINASNSTDWLPVSTNLCELLTQASALSTRTQGAFDITLGGLTNLWGFGPAASTDTPPSAADLTNAMAASGQQRLELDCTHTRLRKQVADLELDLSAFAKGHAVDVIADLLAARDLKNYLVEIGGELRAAGLNSEQRPWSIAIETPSIDSQTVHSILRLRSPAAVATSGDYRNYFEHDGVHYSHTLDPRTGRPVTHSTHAVTVIAKTAAIADGLATALLVFGEQEGMAFAIEKNIAACFLSGSDTNLRQRCTPTFSQWIFPADDGERK